MTRFFYSSKTDKNLVSLTKKWVKCDLFLGQIWLDLGQIWHKSSQFD